jgi:hypothetical protein
MEFKVSLFFIFSLILYPTIIIENFRRKPTVLLTIHMPSWYYQPAKNQPRAGQLF